MVDRWAAMFEESDGPMPAGARAILTEFGGLTVGKHGPGTAYERGRVKFDPEYAWGELEGRTNPIGRTYPLADAFDGHGFMMLANDGAIWTWTLDGVLRHQGASIEEALARILLGRGELRWMPDGATA